MLKRNDKKKWIVGEKRGLAALSSPNIISLSSAFQKNNFVYLVMEYVQGVTLKEVLKKRKLIEEECKVIFGQVLLAVRHMHERGIGHRDLKPENIMLDENLKVKLIDFGYCTTVEKEKRIETEQKDLSAITPSEEETSAPEESRLDLHYTAVGWSRFAHSRMPGDEVATASEPLNNEVQPAVEENDKEKVDLSFSAVGSPLYAAPETMLYAEKGYDSKKVDIWSLGVILFEMLTGKVPFQAGSYRELKKEVKKFIDDKHNYFLPWDSAPPSLSSSCSSLNSFSLGSDQSAAAAPAPTTTAPDFNHLSFASYISSFSCPGYSSPWALPSQSLPSLTSPPQSPILCSVITTSNSTPAAFSLAQPQAVISASYSASSEQDNTGSVLSCGSCGTLNSLVSERSKSLVLRLLDPDFSSRPSVHSVMSDSYFDEGFWDWLERVANSASPSSVAALDNQEQPLSAATKALWVSEILAEKAKRDELVRVEERELAELSLVERGVVIKPVITTAEHYDNFDFFHESVAPYISQK